MTQETTDAPNIKVTRTELVWPGKYNLDGTPQESPRVSLPFQVIERVNETRATREARREPQELSLFDVWEGDEGETFDEGWRNKLIWGDNLLVMSSLLEKFAGELDLIYIDPPFASGADFSFDALIGDSSQTVAKEASVVEEKAYRDTWGAGLDSYLNMLYQRLMVMRELLADKGSIFVHLDWHVVAYVRAMMDEVFGSKNFRNEIIWWYYNKFQGNVRHFPRNHDVLLYYVNDLDHLSFEALHEEREEPTRQIKRKWDAERGKLVNVKGPDGKVQYQTVTTKRVDDVWRIPMIQPADKTENVGYPTQKREEILERVIEASTARGDLVADFFVGSGTTAAVAERLGRRWIAADLSRWAIHVSRKRMLDIEDGMPFEVLNLGQYERQYWQRVTFGGERSTGEQTLYEYLAFILRLYGAEPVSGLAHIHGKKGNAVVHIGSVEAPVTIGEITAAVRECADLKQGELHVLGWEWEMGLYDLMVDEAKKLGVKLVPLQIPREVMEQQAVDQGDIQFFELAYLDVAVHVDGGEVQVELKDFVIPNTELVPDEVRAKVQKWSDYIDYWAIDWRFQDDTFMQGWVNYRTRKDRSLDLVSDPHVYDESGSYTVVVKVIDIFGNDTSQAYQIEVE